MHTRISLSRGENYFLVQKGGKVILSKTALTIFMKLCTDPELPPGQLLVMGSTPPKIAVSQRGGVKNGVKIFRARQFFENFFGGQKKYKNKVFDIFDPKIAPDDVIGVI